MVNLILKPTQTQHSVAFVKRMSIWDDRSINYNKYPGSLTRGHNPKSKFQSSTRRLFIVKCNNKSITKESPGV